MTQANGGNSQATNVRDQQVARVYAEALLKAADKQGLADVLLGQLNSLITDLFQSHPMLEKFLSTGAIRRDVKSEAIDRGFSGHADPLLVNFLQVLNNHDRLGLIRAIYDSYRDLIDEKARRIRVKVRSAAELNDDQRERLKAELRESYNLEPILEVRVEPELLGGFVVQVGDWLFDGSVKSRLDRLRNQLMASSHYVQNW